jgi:hypothetical protein
LLARHNPSASRLLPVISWPARARLNDHFMTGYRIAMAEQHSTTEAADGLLPIVHPITLDRPPVDA